MAPWFRPRATWVVSIEVVVVAATVAVISETAIWRSTYAGASTPAAIADLAAGIGFLAAGSALAFAGLRPPAGWLAVLAGAAWLSADWVGWQGGPALPRTIAMAAVLFYLPLVAHVVALHQVRPNRRITHGLVRLGYASAAALGLVLLLFRDPRIDLYCWSNCADNVFLIGNVPLVASMLGTALPTFEVVVASGIIAVGLMTLAQGATARRHAAVVALPAMLVGATSAIHGIALLADPHEGPRLALHVLIFQLRAVSAALLGAGLAWTVIRAWRSRVAVVRLAADLGNAPRAGTVASALALAAHDPRLEFHYWLPHAGRYVDASGHPREPLAGSEQRSVLRVALAGRLIGVVVHDGSMVDSAHLDKLLGSAARLALENERLQAELLAELEEVRASRTRIVATADAARARLERDLHDGAQQAVLAVMFELRAAAQAAAAVGDAEAHRDLGLAIGNAEAVLAELREIAHGIYPAVLADKGLAAALRTLADTSAIPVEIHDIPGERLPVVAERTGYAVIASAVDVAASAGADGLIVRGGVEEDRLTLDIEGLGTVSVAEITDRISAANGGSSSDGKMLRAWIPCG